MDQHMDELKKELIRLVWEQLHNHHVQLARALCTLTFSYVSFGSPGDFFTCLERFGLLRWLRLSESVI